MAKKNDKKKKMRSVQCSKCRGAGQYVSMTGVGWNSDFWSRCGNCGGTGRITYDANAKRCFIATATYGSVMAPEVMTFRQFRDDILLTSKAGELFVNLYYFISPPFAGLISRSPVLRIGVRKFLLNPILKLLRKSKI